MGQKISIIKREANTWLKKQLKKNNLVFAKSDIKKSILVFLTQEQILAELNNHFVFIKSNQELTSTAFMNNFWPLVLQYLNRAFDNKWYFTGHYAYNFAVSQLSTPLKQITISTQKKSNTIIDLPAGVQIIASYDMNFDKKPLVATTLMDTGFYQVRPEYLVIHSTENEYRTYQNEIISLLKDSEKNDKFFIDFFTENNSPVLLARLIGALRAIEDIGLRIELESLLKLTGAKVAIRNPFRGLTLTQSIERPSYLNRFEISMLKAISVLKTLKKPRRLPKKISAKALDELIVEDTYHSLTIEGYTVTRVLLEFLKNKPMTTNLDEMDLKSQVAAKGFMGTLGYIKKLISSSYTINEKLSKKLFEELWKPSYNAGLIKEGFDIYRKHMVSLKGSHYVPPAHEKIPYLVDEIFEMALEIKNGFDLGIFLHYFYVSVHPHSDGNGRMSRFLMNLAFIKDRYPWITIPSQEKLNYFKALEKSQLSDDISFFAEYIRSRFA